jgi:hypothetical protein
MSYSGLLIIKPEKKYFLKYVGNKNSEELIKKEWKFGVLLRLFIFYIIFDFVMLIVQILL